MERWKKPEILFFDSSAVFSVFGSKSTDNLVNPNLTRDDISENKKSDIPYELLLYAVCRKLTL